MGFRAASRHGFRRTGRSVRVEVSFASYRYAPTRQVTISTVVALARFSVSLASEMGNADSNSFSDKGWTDTFDVVYEENGTGFVMWVSLRVLAKARRRTSPAA